MIESNRIISLLFESFNKSNARWAVLRKADTLPNYFDNDIDILVDKKDIIKCVLSIKNIAIRNGWIIIGETSKYGFKSLTIASKDFKYFIPIDLFTDLYVRYNPWEIVDLSYGLSSRKLINEVVWTVGRGFEVASYLVKEYIINREITAKNIITLEKLEYKDRTLFVNSLTSIIGQEQADLLFQNIIDSSWSQVELLMEAYLKIYIQKPKIKHLHFYTRYTFSYIRRFVRNDMNVFIVILGPDGSGKTTIADELCVQLEKKPFKKTNHVATNFGILPQLKELKKILLSLIGKKMITEVEVEPGTYHSGMNKSEYSFIRLFVYVLWYGLDYALGLIKLSSWKANSNLIVFARYYYDFYFQRGYRRFPSKIIDVISWIVPKPDMIIYIDRSAEDIYNLKPELSIDEIKRQQDIIQKKFSANYNFIEVDGSKGIADTVTQIKYFINYHLIKKVLDK